MPTPSQLAVDLGIPLKADDDVVVKLSGQQDISGLKSFDTIPLVPTAETEANDTKVANTAFVRKLIDDVNENTKRPNQSNWI
jgi:hypothetical protein